MGKTKRVLVIGCGRFGSALAKELWDNGAELIIVDRDERAIDKLKDYAHAAFVADATDVAVLEEAGAREVDAAVVGLGDNFEAAVLTVVALAKWKLPEIVARAASEMRADALRAVGATRVHQVETEMGRRAAIAIITPVAADLLELAAQFRVVPWTASGPLVGQAINACGIRQQYGINVLGIRPYSSAENPATLEQPHPSYVISEGDTLLLVGEEDDVGRFVREVGA
jgi:trk system potassium uptake protein TrkA